MWLIKLETLRLCCQSDSEGFKWLIDKYYEPAQE